MGSVGGGGGNAGPINFFELIEGSGSGFLRPDSITAHWASLGIPDPQDILQVAPAALAALSKLRDMELAVFGTREPGPSQLERPESQHGGGVVRGRHVQSPTHRRHPHLQGPPGVPQVSRLPSLGQGDKEELNSRATAGEQRNRAEHYRLEAQGLSQRLNLLVEEMDAAQSNLEAAHLSHIKSALATRLHSTF